MKRFINAEIRGRILIALQYGYPGLVGDQLLTNIMQDAQYPVSPQIVSGHLTYLEAKGYLELETVEARELSMTRILAKLTPKGVDLLDGNIEADPGVRLP